MSQPSIAQVVTACSDLFAVSELDIRSQRRDASSVLARQWAMWAARRFTKHSLPTIGRCIGDRDHTTVIHAIRKIEGRTASHAASATIAQALTRTLTSTRERTVP